MVTYTIMETITDNVRDDEEVMEEKHDLFLEENDVNFLNKKDQKNEI